MPARAEVFARYRKAGNAVFVETGSYTGGGIACALEAGFKRVLSIEIQPSYHELCKRRFHKRKEVELILGDSALKLGEVIKTIDAPITFWLDGHFSGLDTGFGVKGAPILEELEHIRQHPRAKEHTILIDDRRMLQRKGNGGKDTYFELEESDVVKKLKEINPDFHIGYEDGHVPNDVIVASPTPIQAKLKPSELLQMRPSCNCLPFKPKIEPRPKLLPNSKPMRSQNELRNKILDNK